MARIPIADTSIHQLATAQKLEIVAGSQDLAGQNADATEFNSVPCTGKEVVVVENLAATPQTVTIHAAPDPIQRAGSFTPPYEVAAGYVSYFGPFPVSGYRQEDEQLYIDCDSVDMKIAILRLP